MNAFNEGGRSIRIMGTKGEIRAMMKGDQIEVYSFLTSKARKVDVNSMSTSETILGGHGGGDTGIIAALVELLKGNKIRSVCDIRESCDNHMISFAAEESRVSGKVVDVEEFMSRFDA
jgi:hypothetical protein